MMQNQKLAFRYAIISVLLWSTIASAFKLSLIYIDFIHLLLGASLVSLITFFIIIILQKKLPLLKACSKKDYINSAILGFLNPFLYYIVLFRAYSLLPAQEAQPLNYTWPIALVLLSIPLLKQKISLNNIVAVIISFLGVLVIGTRGNLFSLKFHDPVGVFLAVGSSLIWSIFWIYNVKDTKDPVIKLFLNFAFGFIFTLIATILFSNLMIPQMKGLLGIIYVGLFEMGITFVFWIKALKLSVTTAKVSNLVFFSPFISLIFIYLVLGERILASSIIGLVLIIIGVIIQQYSPQRHPDENRDYVILRKVHK